MADIALPRAAEPPDRRFGGSWTRTQSFKNFVIRGVVRAVLQVADRLPRSVLLTLGETLGRMARTFDDQALSRARERSAASLIESMTADVAIRCFANAGRALAFCALLRRDEVRAGDYVTFTDASRAVLQRALSLGRGALVVSAHLGPFEMIPARLVEAGFAPAIVVRESYDPGLDRVVDHHRRRRGIEVIHRGEKRAALRIVRALQDGRPVGVLPDLGGRGMGTLPIPFLGRTVAFPVGAQQLARRTGCPLVIGTLARSSTGPAPFELCLEELTIAGDEAETLAQLTRRVASALERAIARSPEHWLWMAAPHLAIADDSDRSLSSEIIRQSGSSRA
jgi:KDO2-lipid IV(A) lauroyltransferase